MSARCATTPAVLECMVVFWNFSGGDCNTIESVVEQCDIRYYFWHVLLVQEVSPSGGKELRELHGGHLMVIALHG